MGLADRPCVRRRRSDRNRRPRRSAGPPVRRPAVGRCPRSIRRAGVIGPAGPAEIAGQREQAHQRMRRAQRKQHLAGRPAKSRTSSQRRGGAGISPAARPAPGWRHRWETPLPALIEIGRIGLADTAGLQRLAFGEPASTSSGARQFSRVIWPTWGWSMTIRS